MRRVLAILLFSLFIMENAYAQTVLIEESEQATFRVDLVASGFDFAWDIEFLPTGDIVLSEYDGSLRVIRDGVLQPNAIPAIENVTPDGGLRGIAAHPDFAANQWLYFCYASGSAENNHTRIARGRFDGERVSDLEDIFIVDNAARQLAHYGCRLLWSKNGKLIATLGDRRHHADASQDLSNHYGVAIRLNDDGSVPEDNPFVGEENARPEIWAFGLRNVQGAIYRPDEQELWISEHGPLGGDEVNILRRGENYGWPVATYGIDYSGEELTDTPLRDGVTPPLYYWYPSIAPSSIAFYNGDDFAKWRGDVFVGSLAARRLFRLELNGDRILRVEELLSELDVRIRDVSMGPDGSLYVLTDTGDGRLLRLGPTTVD